MKNDHFSNKIWLKLVIFAFDFLPFINEIIESIQNQAEQILTNSNPENS